MDNSATQWRLFIGQWDDRDDGEVGTLTTYAAGRAYLAERLGEFAQDSCEDCREAAYRESTHLEDLPEGAEFVGEVEGDDYLLIRADRESLSDLWAERVRPPVGARRWHGPWDRWYTVVETPAGQPFDEVAVVSDDGQQAIVKVRSLMDAPRG